MLFSKDGENVSRIKDISFGNQQVTHSRLLPPNYLTISDLGNKIQNSFINSTNISTNFVPDFFP